MALRAVPDHPKFAHLKSLLKLPKGAVLGYLECVWHFAGRFTPQGNIGKYSDLAIETWVEWDGEEGKLVDALLKSGWLDADEGHRLIVHDWHQHADRATRMALKRAKLEFLLPGVYTVCAQRENTVTEVEHGVSTAWTLPGAGAVPVPVPEPVPGAVVTTPPDELPPDMPMLNYARWTLEECNIPVTMQNQMSAAAGIGAYAKEHGLPANKAAPELARLARDAMTSGGRVDRWWFDDAKWRGNANANGNRAQARTDGNKLAAQRAYEGMFGADGGPG